MIVSRDKRFICWSVALI